MLKGYLIVVFSYVYWQLCFDCDFIVINKVFQVNGQVMIIVGVIFCGFCGMMFGNDLQIFVLFSMCGVMILGWDDYDE